ncbi:unnamed protein product [Brassicogethes aeneus]|uniref:C2H2-type domain-containing protein n=1 Tax=Brassicogethes aeneus TaxID=1431903 RepID=A0A9P0BB78_BRAAE|nr:unnamed protein product [Brassicogethes aeneus]
MYNLKLHVSLNHKEQNKVEKKVDTGIIYHVKTIQVLCKNDMKKKPVESPKKFACPYCPAVMKRRYNLQKHIFFVHENKQDKAKKKMEVLNCGEKYDSCPYCHKLKCHLENHVYKMHKEQNEKERKVTIKINYCDNCDYSNPDQTEFQRHVKKCKKPLPLWQCPDCSYRTNSKEKLKLHVKLNSNIQLTCSYCPFTSKCRPSFWKHTKKHSKFEVCPYCEHSTSDKHNLQRHVYNNHKHQNDVENKVEITDSVFKCTFCGYSTMDKSGFSVHIYKGASAFICCVFAFVVSSAIAQVLAKEARGLPSCNSELGIFSYWNTINDPFVNVNTKNELFNIKMKYRHDDIYMCTQQDNPICPYCDFQVPDMYNLKLHISVNHKAKKKVDTGIKYHVKTIQVLRKNDNKTLKTDESPKKEGSCPYCPVIMRQKFCLQRHVYYKHRELNKAEKKFEFSSSYLQNVSNDEKYESCPYCNKLKCHLQEHVYKMPKKQNDEYESCPYCNKLKFHLQEHVYKMHKKQNEKEKKVKITIKINYCDNCDYSHPDLAEFQQHAKKCKDLTLFRCPDCSYSTNSMEQLNLHVKFVTCSFCPFTFKCHRSFWSHTQKHKKFEVNKGHLLLYCPDCTFSTNSKEQLNLHINYITCSFCPFTSKCRPSFLNHKRIHSKYACPYCGHSTSNNHNLQSHVYNHHKQQNNVENKVKITGNVFKCKFCAYSTMGKTGFKSHKEVCKEKHSGLLSNLINIS